MEGSSSAATTASASFFAPRRRSKTTVTNPSNGSSDRVDNNTALIPSMIRAIPSNELPQLPSGRSSSNWKSRIRYLTPNKSSWVLHLPRFCCPPQQRVFREFWNARPKQQHSLVMFGKKVRENRFSAMYATTKAVGNYTYSGSSRPCRVCDANQPQEKFVLDLCEAADGIVRQLMMEFETTKGLARPEKETPRNYNACLVNWYTPEHTIGLHSDDEPEMDNSWPILSLSWGGPRRFLMRARTTSSRNNKVGAATSRVGHEFVLRDGDLLVMGGKCQEEFKHEIPKVRSTKDGLVTHRISWTIRRMRPTRLAANVAATNNASVGGEARKNGHGQEKNSAGKRTWSESSEAMHNPHKPRKKAAIYNPYARNRV